MIPYNVIYADPPWRFKTRSRLGEGRSPSAYYDTMTPAEIAAYPVQQYAAQDCVLLMWTTDPFLEASFSVIKAWGFRYKTVGFYWIKTGKDYIGRPIGTGYWTRANPELCLLATRGHPKRTSKNVHKLIEAPRREYSQKPDGIYDRIEQLVAGPYLELFARQRWPGWDAVGKEVDSGPAQRRWHADGRELKPDAPGSENYQRNILQVARETPADPKRLDRADAESEVCGEGHD
jgi:N6-adenosine-specific RNA methylase IME4